MSVVFTGAKTHVTRRQVAGSVSNYATYGAFEQHPAAKHIVATRGGKSYCWIAMEWRPATIDEVRKFVRADLEKCDPQQIAVFRQYSVDPYFAPIERYGKLEKVVVVAYNSGEVMYWEDVEEGFNTSPVGADGHVLQHWCNQDDLGTALNQWIEGRESGKLGPPKPLPYRD